MNVMPTPKPSAQAEVKEIWPRGGQIRICGAVTGSARCEGDLLVRAREAQDTRLALPTIWHGDRFEASIPLEMLAGDCPQDERTWDLYLSVVGSDEPLRLGTHQDDIVGKKKIFVYPAQRAAGVRVVPFYTVKDNVSIACHREAA